MGLFFFFALKFFVMLCQLLTELIDLETETGYILPNSPTQIVGYDILKGFKKVEHPKKLYSLDKCNSDKELTAWIDNLKYKYGVDDVFALVIILKQFLSEEKFKDFCEELDGFIDNLDYNLSTITIVKVLDRMGFPKDYIEIISR